MLTVDDRQRALALYIEISDDLIRLDVGEWWEEMTRRMSEAFPGIMTDELDELEDEAEERDHAASLRQDREAEREDYITSITARDPGWHTGDATDNCLRRLAAAGDQEAAAILEDWASPLSRAVKCVVDGAVAAAFDWKRHEDRRIGAVGEGSRKFSQLLKDHLDQAGFDVLALLPDDLRDEVNAVHLLLEVNRIIQEAKDEGD